MPKGIYDRSRARKPGTPKLKPDKQSRVFWNAQEIAIINTAVFQEFILHPERGLPGPLVNAVVKKVMPESRQRTLVGKPALKPFITGLHERLNQFLEGFTAPPAPTPAPTPEPAPMPPPEPSPIDVHAVLADLSFPILSGVYHQRLAARDALWHEEETAAREGRKPNPPVVEEIDFGIITPEHLKGYYPKIVIVGLRLHAVTELKQRLRNHPLNFIAFIDPSTTKPDIKQLHIKEADLLLVDTGNTTEEWRSLVSTAINEHHIEPNEVIRTPGLERIIQELQRYVTGWRTKNKQLATFHDNAMRNAP